MRIYLTPVSNDTQRAIPEATKFSLSFDGQPATITSLTSAKDEKLLFALLLDASGSNASIGDSTKAVAAQIFEKLSAMGGQGYLVIFKDRVFISQHTLSSEEVKTALAPVRFSKGTSLLDAIQKTCEQPLSRQNNPAVSRKIIVLLTDGEDSASTATREQAIQSAQKAGVSIFSMNTLSGHPEMMSLSEHRHAQALFEQVSGETGGQWFSTTLDKSATDLLNAINDQWVLSFLAPPHSDGKLHALQLRFAERGMRLTYTPEIGLP